MERIAIEERGPAAGPGHRAAARTGEACHGLGLFGGEQIRRSVVAFEREAALNEAVDRTGDLLEQPDDIVVPRRGQLCATPRGEAGLIIAGALVELAAGASLIAYGRAHPEQHSSRRSCWEIDLSSPGNSSCGQSGGNPAVPGFVVSGVGALELAFGIYKFATNQYSITPRRSR